MMRSDAAEPVPVVEPVSFPRANGRGVLSFDEFQQAAYFNTLDGWRAVSILMVVLFHAPRLELSFLHTLQGNGHYGVSFFFAISGFIITTLLLREERKCGQINLWRFYGRRALRLLPLYYTVLLMESVLVLVFHQYSPQNEALFREKFLSYVFYCSNWLPTSGVGPFFYSWSLAVEEQFYLVFGLLIFWCPRRILIGLAIAAWVFKPFIFQVYGPLDADSMFWRITLSYHEPILMGVLTAYVLNERAAYEAVARVLGRRAVYGAILGALAICLSLLPFEGKSSLPAQALYVLMILAIVGGVMRPSVPVLTSRAFLHWGKISYGIYLLHAVVMAAVWKYVSNRPTVALLASICGMTVLATLSYKYFEGPIIAFSKRRLAARPEPGPRLPAIGGKLAPIPIKGHP
ncbi:MAG TPA: acyltransferase [Verrucomicrobiae bacterium]|nr:acyltransferase [Verrucomicrobiae bacterium]